jgi:outer membrane protein assembly factor BamD
MRRFAMALWAAGLLAGCASNTGGGAADEDDGSGNPSLQPGRGEVSTTVTYESTAEGNFQRGEVAYKEEQYLAAQRYFGYIRSKFPYSRFAVLAELRVADCQYMRQRYLEAIDSYQNFARLHPNHEKVPYAMFKVGMSHFSEIPSNFFLLPPAHEKDQAAVRDAARALESYLERFADDENAAEAKKVLEDVRRRLMDHERYVADFYKNEERYRAYVGRLEVIRAEFADVGLTDALLLEIVEVWARLGEVAKATAALQQLEAAFPKSELIPEARRAVAEAPSEPVQDAAPATPDDQRIAPAPLDDAG